MCGTWFTGFFQLENTSLNQKNILYSFSPHHSLRTLLYSRQIQQTTFEWISNLITTSYNQFLSHLNSTSCLKSSATNLKAHQIEEIPSPFFFVRSAFSRLPNSHVKLIIRIWDIQSFPGMTLHIFLYAYNLTNDYLSII